MSIEALAQNSDYALVIGDTVNAKKILYIKKKQNEIKKNCIKADTVISLMKDVRKEQIVIIEKLRALKEQRQIAKFTQ